MGLVKLISNFDGFARLPKDLTQVTATGGAFSFIGFFIMAVIVSLEFKQLFELQTTTVMSVDEDNELEMEIHFNITLLEMPCEFTEVDIIDTFGTNRLDYEVGVTKVRLHHGEDGEWIKGDDHLEEQYKVESSLDNDEFESSIEDFEFPKGKHAPDIKMAQFDKFNTFFQLVFVNFYAPWCIWSQRLAPEWEKTAAALDKKRWGRKEIHVKMLRVNCVDQEALCARYKIRGYPSMQLFKSGEKFGEQYRQERSQWKMLQYLEENVKKFEVELPNVFHDVGCEVSGKFKVNRCPGNFHLKAKSGEHSISPTMSNLSHTVNHLSFGAPLDPRLQVQLPQKFQHSLHPLNGKTYVTETLHASPQHYIKVVSSKYRVGQGVFTAADASTYQITSTNRIATVSEKDCPQAKFKYNFSPVSIHIRHESMSVYHFVTRFFAVLGGSFTLLTVFKDGFQSISNAFSSTSKINPGKLG